MSIELLKLPNVRMHKDTKLDESNLNSDAKALAWEVATKHPLWTLAVTGPRSYLVLCDTEKLGSIGSEWYGSTHKLFVRNDRIKAGSLRKDAYHTDKVDKAYLRVKKTFGPMNLTERIEKAKKVAENVLDNQAYNTRQQAREHERAVESALMRFARTHFSQCKLWLKDTHQTSVLEHITLLEGMKVDMMTIKQTTDEFQNNNTALVVLADGKYIVKIRDNVQLYDDVTLPHELRGKLGMLKLVEKEAMVTGMGCRVNDEIFVLMLEGKRDEDQPTTA